MHSYTFVNYQHKHKYLCKRKCVYVLLYMRARACVCVRAAAGETDWPGPKGALSEPPSAGAAPRLQRCRQALSGRAQRAGRGSRISLKSYSLASNPIGNVIQRIV